MKHHSLLPLVGIGLFSSLASLQANAHGWVEFPNARQNVCYQDGGFWTNEIPNAACQASFDKSGAFPFVQRSEISANVPNYRDMEHVKAIIPDGQLCSAGDRSKRGLSVASSAWQRTNVTLDDNNQIELVFFGKAPHNPSYWEFYLSKPTYDTSTPLSWDDLELIDTAGNVPVDAEKRYRINVTFPTDRAGDAVLFTRWQRIDPVGEGFYNCSDITLIGDNVTPPVTPEEPEPNDPTLTALDYFVPQGFGPIEAGDTVRFRSFTPAGNEIIDFSLTIDASNTQTWPSEIADNFNGQQNGDWFIGVWQPELNQFTFDNNNLFANQVFAPSKDESFALSLIKAEIPEPPPTTTPDNLWKADLVYNSGDQVTYDGKTWTAQWWTRNEIPGTTGPWGVWR